LGDKTIKKKKGEENKRESKGQMQVCPVCFTTFYEGRRNGVVNTRLLEHFNLAYRKDEDTVVLTEVTTDYYREIFGSVTTREIYCNNWHTIWNLREEGVEPPHCFDPRRHGDIINEGEEPPVSDSVTEGYYRETDSEDDE
jgi:hypothetical protein